MTAADVLNATFMTVPGLERHQHGERVEFRNRAAGTAQVFGSEIDSILDDFAEPQKLGPYIAKNKSWTDSIVRAVSHAMLSDIDKITRRAQSPIGKAVLCSEVLQQDLSGVNVVFGAPVDMASTGRGGARKGPDEIRDAFENSVLEVSSDEVLLDFEMGRSYGGPHPRVFDLGCVVPIPGESNLTYGPRIEALTALVLQAGGRPGILGGDHSCTTFALRAVLQRHDKIGILHFDAHHDLWPAPAPQYGYLTHASALREAALDERVAVLMQLGLRMMDRANPATLRFAERLKWVNARQLSRVDPARVFADLDENIPYYLSFDIDCLDPVVAPETGTPLPGGLGYDIALDLVDHAARHLNIIGWDMVEVGQRQFAYNNAAICASKIIQRIVFGTQEFEQINPHIR